MASSSRTRRRYGNALSAGLGELIEVETGTRLSTVRDNDSPRQLGRFAASAAPRRRRRDGLAPGAADRPPLPGLNVTPAPTSPGNGFASIIEEKQTTLAGAARDHVHNARNALRDRKRGVGATKASGVRRTVIARGFRLGPQPALWFPMNLDQGNLRECGIHLMI
jgi:hypothetical protein